MKCNQCDTEMEILREGRYWCPECGMFKQIFASESADDKCRVPRIAREREKERYAVSASLVKNNPGGFNITTNLRLIDADSEYEAIGKYVVMADDEYPEHYIHARPIALKV